MRVLGATKQWKKFNIILFVDMVYNETKAPLFPSGVCSFFFFCISFYFWSLYSYLAAIVNVTHQQNK